MTDTWVETKLSDLGIDVPAWIDQDIDASTVTAIVQGGCASGAYMPAVMYHEASETMNEHGDNVLDAIAAALGELPAIHTDASWSGIAVSYLSTAIELWADGALDEITEKLEEREDS